MICKFCEVEGKIKEMESFDIPSDDIRSNYCSDSQCPECGAVFYIQGNDGGWISGEDVEKQFKEVE